MLDKVLRIGRLYDFYVALLTDKQRRCLEMHFFSDLSLAEIADEFQVSRQAVHDILHRGEQLLEEYEQKLGLAERQRRERETIRQAWALLNDTDGQRTDGFKRAMLLLTQMIDQKEEV
jgi:uncharacterized protein